MEKTFIIDSQYIGIHYIPILLKAPQRQSFNSGGGGGFELTKDIPYRGPSQYKDCLSRYGDCHGKDKTVVRPSYLEHGDSYTGKIASFLFIETQPRMFWSTTYGGSFGKDDHHISKVHCIVIYQYIMGLKKKSLKYFEQCSSLWKKVQVGASRPQASADIKLINTNATNSVMAPQVSAYEDL